MICDGNEAGNSCVFTCQRGYNLIGSQIRHCLRTLQWSGSTTSCAPMNCTPVPHTANANLNLPCSGQYNTSCSIRCANGYTLVGSGIQHCTFDDNTRAVEWTSAPSSCNSKLVCMLLSIIVHFWIGLGSIQGTYVCLIRAKHVFINYAVDITIYVPSQCRGHSTYLCPCMIELYGGYTKYVARTSSN